MSLLLKDPAAVLDYAVNWSAEYLDTDRIVDSDWTVEPTEADGVAVVSSDVADGSAIVTVGGGLAGHLYRLSNRVTLESGREDRRSIMLRVEKR